MTGGEPGEKPGGKTCPALLSEATVWRPLLRALYSQAQGVRLDPLLRASHISAPQFPQF